MSGRRRKALKRAFIASWGRPPEGARLLGYTDDGDGSAVWKRDEMRPIKKAYVRGRR